VEIPSGPASSLRRRLFGEGEDPHPVVLVAGAVVVVVGVVLRFWTPSALWLDEALTVNIARLPLHHIPDALSHDGSPPLYYVLLHFWTGAFGTGDFAARSLSGVISVAALPPFWIAGKRLGGRTVAWVVFFLALTSPFAIAYATSARMYSLMILLCVLGFIAVSRALDDPTLGRLAEVAVVTAALLYTHYWGLYLVAVTAAWLLWKDRSAGRTGVGVAGTAGEVLAGRTVLKAVGAGCLLWLPWAPVFAFQTLHTGTPWTSAAGPGDLLGVFSDYAGSGPWATLLMFATFALFILGVFGRPAGAHHGGSRPADWSTAPPAGVDRAVIVSLRPRPETGPLAAITIGTLTLAVLLGALANAAFVARYTSVVLPLFLLVVAAGVAAFPSRRFQVGCVSVLCVAGLLTGYSENAQQRTQAVQIASVLNSQAQPGDMVVYCPDQLGPAVHRLIHVPDLVELTFPRAIGPERVDWVDYKQTVAGADVGQFAQDLLNRLGGGRTLWLVWRDGYPGLGGDCGYLNAWLGLLRSPGPTVVRANGARFYEYANLTRFAP
jgi:hypothetical protein